MFQMLFDENLTPKPKWALWLDTAMSQKPTAFGIQTHDESSLAEISSLMKKRYLSPLRVTRITHLFYPTELEEPPATEMISSDSVGTLPAATVRQSSPVNQPLDIVMEETPSTTELTEELHPGDLRIVRELQPDLQENAPRSSSEIQQIELAQPRRTSRKPILKFENFKGLISSSGDLSTELTKTLAEPFEPLSYQQALSCDQADKWKAAIFEEYESLMKNKTWELVPLPPDSATIKSRWLLKVKPGQNNVPERYKARLVTKGYTQRKDITTPMPQW
jgi:hypothetical protein